MCVWQSRKRLLRRKEALSGSRREVQRAARDRRRELLATGQSYWAGPTPLRVVSLPGEEAEDELDEDALMAEFLGLDGDGIDEDALMAEFLGLDGDESRCVEALDGQLTVDGDVADAMIDPMLFDPKVLEGTAADEHVELLVAEEEAVASTEVEVDGGDSVVVGVVGAGEVVALDEAPRAEVVAVDSDEAPYKVVASDSDSYQALRLLVVASDSNEAPRTEDGDSDEAPYKVVASDSDETSPKVPVVANDSDEGKVEAPESLATTSDRRRASESLATTI